MHVMLMIAQSPVRIFFDVQIFFVGPILLQTHQKRVKSTGCLAHLRTLQAERSFVPSLMMVALATRRACIEPMCNSGPGQETSHTQKKPSKPEQARNSVEATWSDTSSN